MEKPCIKSQFHFISERPVRYAVTLPIIWLPFPASQMSRSWKARRLSATSSRADCRVARLFLIGSSETRRRPVSQQICIRNSHPSARRAAENSRVVTARREKRDDRTPTNGRARPPRFHKMIGEGIQSTNQRRHSYVHDNVEVGFFRDPTVCNGCGYCVVSCPFGVIDRRPRPLPESGGAFKCTFCYDRQKSGLVPACAKVCPTESIVFGRLDDLRARAAQRVQELHQDGYNDAQLYDPTETSVRGIHAFFLILGEPEAYGLPPKPQVPTSYLKSAWTSAIATAIGALIAIVCAFAFL